MQSITEAEKKDWNLAAHCQNVFYSKKYGWINNL